MVEPHLLRNRHIVETVLVEVGICMVQRSNLAPGLGRLGFPSKLCYNQRNAPATWETPERGKRAAL
jgi:hypothetical protein